jgi:thioredoxin 1
MAGNVKEITESTFKTDVLENSLLVLVDFWAPWCGPCRVIAPVVEELANDYAGKVSVVKINVDDNPSIATRYGVQSIPTVLFFKGGQPVERIIGAVMKQTLQETIDKHV